MRKFFMQFFNKQPKIQDYNFGPEKMVDFSIEKYRDTYKLLEEYDMQTPRALEILANPGPLRKALQKN